MPSSPVLISHARSLRAAGCLVVSLDYRNFPQGTVSDMTADVSAGVAWVLRHAAKWGGDCERCARGGGCRLPAQSLTRLAA